MASVRERYAQLHDVVGSLSEKITAVLVRQEKDFLAAYRAHMYNVQKELHDTKEKVTRNETIENKSEKIKLLEEERDWYRKEALRLDAFTTTMKKDLKHMKEKLESIEEDRDWLEKQLKASKKQNKLLRAELEIRLANLSTQHSDTTALFERPSSPADDGRTASDMQLPLAVVEREESFRKQIRQLKRELQHSKRDVNRLRSDNSKHDANQLEAFFLLSIEAVKRDVVRRKTQGHHDPELKDFTSADRIRVIERLLAHDEVLSILYDNLFPEHKPEIDEGKQREARTPPVGSAVAAVRDGGGLPLDEATLSYLKLKNNNELGRRMDDDSINQLLQQTQRCSFDCQSLFNARVAAMEARNHATTTTNVALKPPQSSLIAAPDFRTRFRTPTQYDLKVESAKKNITSTELYRPPSLHTFRDENADVNVGEREFTAKFALPDNQDMRRHIAADQEGFLTGASIKAVVCDRSLPRGQNEFRLQLPHTNSKTGNLNLRLHVTLDQAGMFSGRSQHAYRSEGPVDPRFVLEFSPSGVGQGCVDIGTHQRPGKNA
ncbi:hypothetical protein SPRG_19348 [Saprolegnia parasitica CBS 223.65]|uniref:Uncharacterized protein n=1 Tax=Saprolegnia parasitica (strain CBS 223.65) TaxID=695850 RepID=A0A067D402_SAPPC|nr:hypothetical protein SPRG_19348 [Saprolegnia parasitica CBS 223.65]KDO33742.1 hypothetical protein SPRG_19348 [Saprolegnia parasitica CBS 223.65]|eukprot:XP_012195757.1 hypothetical protein SPRG_19348 [Saprolegnia parasitica CBS 223.65]